ncbi:Lipase-3 domain-containing protein [Aphelenchoides bicaudatus]|nr:Lipase-3 domain-containing protein [Aphelenchoides bicaudatus]
MFAPVLLLLSLSVFVQSTPVPKRLIDPPANPLHFVKVTDELKKQIASGKAVFGQQAKKVPHVSKWDAHDPGYYTDAFARSFMMPLAAAAYADDPSLCLKSKFKNATLSTSVITTCEAEGTKDECAGFTAVSHDEKAIIVSFRGTNTFLELVTEVNHVVLKNKQNSPIGGKVAFYFYSVFSQLWEAGLGKDADLLLKQYKDYEIWVTGHSLGGAVASIAATWMLNEYDDIDADRIKLVTFGQPRTGDTDYALAHNLKLPRSYRVTHKRDIVPHTPPEYFESYFHHESEIWYPDGMKAGDKFIVCNDGESQECSDMQWLDTSISDHLHYFDKYLSVYGLDGCSDEVQKL